MGEADTRNRRRAGWSRIALAVGLLGLLACAAPRPDLQGHQPIAGAQHSTYMKYLPLARAGDPKYQNLLGFMHFFGEGAALDHVVARDWFRMAASQGYPLATRNLATMVRLGLPPDGQAADRHADPSGTAEHLVQARRAAPLADGRPGADAERIYATFCAGCHGLNGISAYIESPSFALGERMEKSDAALLNSIRDGVGVMPGWDAMLSDPVVRELVAVVRSFEPRYQAGIVLALREAPRTFFLFGPMLDDESAYRRDRAE